MYNRYISAQTPYEAVQGEGRKRAGKGQSWDRDKAGIGQEKDRDGTGKGQSTRKGGLGGLLDSLGGSEGAGQAISSILKAFHLENLDSSDILLALIILFLILEDGDNLDLIITLGLMILFSLGET